jgi:DNA-binding FadR family transcriptional regulator
LREQFYRYRVEDIRDIQDYSILITEHEQLMNAIFNHDKDAARHFMNTHIKNQKERVSERIRN